jgi:hypothetical protein
LSAGPSALTLNVHFHSLLIDGVYTRDRGGRAQFHPVAAPRQRRVDELVGKLEGTPYCDRVRKIPPDYSLLPGDACPPSVCSLK